MADLKKIKAKIREIAQGNRRNVTREEIEWVVRHLGLNGFTTTARMAGDHAKLFGINNLRFSISIHTSSGSRIKRCYVNEFIDVMMELGLYDD